MLTAAERRKKVYSAIAEFGGLIPSRHLHARRNDFNVVPCGTATLVDTGERIKQRNRSCRVFQDTTSGIHWVKQPWYLNMFHLPWRNYKFLAYDSDVVVGAKGSSEIVIPKTAKVEDHCESFDCSRIESGSYNFHTTGLKHYLADVLPVAIYCNRVGA